MNSPEPGRPNVSWFDRNFFRSNHPITRIGFGELGGKASGLVRIRDLLETAYDGDRFSGIEVYVPKMVVVATDVFDDFMERNGLLDTALSDCEDAQLAEAFQQAELPVEILGDLRALAEEVRTPLAVRSSSLLEDALQRPFAGVYGTKMLPNNPPDADTRFRRLVEAVKYVYASTYSRGAKSYIRATEHAATDEKMAVIIQEVVGYRHDERFYPDVSGVGRSYNFFPTGDAKPADGVVNLALGLGKTIVDGGVSWIYTPTRPRAPMPFNSVGDVLKQTQLSFWAVNMGPPPAYDPIAETEYLVQADLAAADYDNTLTAVASTYDAKRDRFIPGTARPGPRAVDFAPLLGSGQIPLNDVVRELLALGEQALGDPVEIEFAVELPRRERETARLGFLQLRPMLVSKQEVEVNDADLEVPGLLLATDRAIGNGAFDAISDIVYVRPESFQAKLTPTIASELERINRILVEEDRPYLLLGFGRWGSSDPWLGIPVEWGQIAGARVIVESTLPDMNVELSQGAHFFHNLLSFEVPYLSVAHDPGAAGYLSDIDWAWLDSRAALNETALVRHVRLQGPLAIKVDGRRGRGAIWHDRTISEDNPA